MEENEKELVCKARAGDKKAFETLVRQCGDKLMGLAYHLTGSREDSEDVLQSALLAAFKHIAGFNGLSSFSSWLYRITVNEWLQKRRKEYRGQKIQKVSLDGPLFQDDCESDGNIRLIDRLSDGKDSPEKYSEQKELLSRLRKALLSLEKAERAIIVLADFQGTSYEEIAVILDCPVGTVRSRLSRARESLRKQFNG